MSTPAPRSACLLRGDGPERLTLVARRVVFCGAPDIRVQLNRSRLSDKVKDRSHVTVSDAEEVKHWCAKFGCSETQLRAAVKMVGFTVSKVRQHLVQRK